MFLDCTHFFPVLFFLNTNIFSFPVSTHTHTHTHTHTTHRETHTRGHLLFCEIPFYFSSLHLLTHFKRGPRFVLYIFHGFPSSFLFSSWTDTTSPRFTENDSDTHPQNTVLFGSLLSGHGLESSKVGTQIQDDQVVAGQQMRETIHVQEDESSESLGKTQASGACWHGPLWSHRGPLLSMLPSPFCSCLLVGWGALVFSSCLYKRVSPDSSVHPTTSVRYGLGHCIVRLIGCCPDLIAAWLMVR